MNRKTIDRHNSYQRHYYENALLKPAMQIRDTPYVRRHVDRIIRHGNLSLPQTILEVGAGLGKFSMIMLQRGFKLTCNDLSPVQLAYLQAHAPSSVQTIACDILDIANHTEETFDQVIGFFTLHHMIDLPKIFGGLKKVLKPGAGIAFIEPRGVNPLYYLQIAMTPGMSMRAERGILDMSDRVVHQAMGEAGLEPMASVSYGFLPPFLANRGWGGKLEEVLDRHAWLNLAHAFLLFRARNPW